MQVCGTPPHPTTQLPPLKLYTPKLGQPGDSGWAAPCRTLYPAQAPQLLLMLSKEKPVLCSIIFSPLYGLYSMGHYLNIEHFLQIKEKVTSGDSQIQAHWT